ncbi:MAG TPA: copper resistance protein CopC, partial [Candidatus Dormibacteraeota bacterium]|nr:copper resistance protein CopC [Candidatus Dormibacteraeota bacterium]
GWCRLAAFSPALIAVALVALAAAPGDVAAHAYLRSSQPAAGATLGSAPSSVVITFSEPPDPKLSSIKVVDSSGTDYVTGPIVVVASTPATISVPLDTLADGVYTVSWRAVSATDGHISAGSFVFGVGEPPPSEAPGQAPAGVSQSGSPPAIAARWLLYLGIVALFGAAWVALAVVRKPARDLLIVAAAGWMLTFVGTLVVIGVQWAETGAPIETLIGTSVGTAALARAISLLLVGGAVVALAAVPAFAGTRGWIGVAITASIVLAVDVGTGHAAYGADSILQFSLQFAHGLASAAWVGGLASLLVVLRTTPAEDRGPTARRYSSWAGIALGVVVITGAFRAFVEIGSLDALFNSDFGRVVLLKSALLLGLASLGAFNRFVTLRDDSRLHRRLRRVGGTEIAIAVVVLGLSGLLVNLSPPALAGTTVAPPPQPIVASGSDSGTSVRARLIVTPGGAASNAFDLALTDYDTGAPTDASAAKLRFAVASLSGVATSTLDLTRASAGHYSGSGQNLSIDGIWKLTITATLPGGAVEIPLVVATKVSDQPVRQLVSPGVPTIYQLALGTTGSAQLYLDPGSPGKNDVHVTFFDAAGTELPTNSATIAIAAADGTGQLVAARMLEPGHFVGTVNVGAGPLTVDVVTPLPAARGSGQIHLHVTMQVTP